MNNLSEKIGKPSDFTRAIDAVLLELAYILSGYRDSLVVSGGLAMHLLFGDRQNALPYGDSVDEGDFFARVTKDVDFVLNLVQLDQNYDDQIENIGELLTQNNYQLEVPKQHWVKGVRLSGFEATISVPVELLSPIPPDTGEQPSLLQRVRELHEIRPVALDGIALALIRPKMILLSGETPSGLQLTDVPIQVVDPAMLILIKAIAFADRLDKREREPSGNHLDQAAKHAYDISQLLYRYPGGVPALFERLVPPYITNVVPEQPTIYRALEVLRTHFSSKEGRGISLMAGEGKYYYDESDKDRAQQATVSRVKRLLERLDEKIDSTY